MRLHRPSTRSARTRARSSVARATRRATIAACLAGAWLVAPGPLGAAAGSSGGGAPSQPAGYPIGVFDLKEPSFYAPPKPSALAGYSRVYVNDFIPTTLSSQWDRFSGVPKGDPAGRFEPSHVQLSGGVLELGTWRDPKHHDQWATGGVCLCGVHLTYGAVFVRSRQTAVGPDNAELLWPLDNVWPPEVDFSESGDTANASAWFDHYSPPPHAYHDKMKIDVEHWHTWGVVWTPTSLTFVVDGKPWGTEVTDPAAIPTEPMTLDLQQQTWCGIYPECPKVNSELLIDWVTIYRPT